MSSELPTGWRETSIRDLGRVVTGKTPPKKEASYFDGPIPFIRIPDMRNQRFIESTEMSLSASGADVIKGAVIPVGSVSVSCIATIGEVSVTTERSVTNQQINSVIPSGDADALFLYYSFHTLSNQLSAAAGGGSVYENISKSRFSNLSIALPPLPEQRRIAWVLGTLDDKIELNRKMAQTLEETAAAIFKARFVDFEGVEEFEDSEIGAIPKGWPVSSVGSVATVIKGKSYKSDELESSSTALVTLKSIKRGGGYSQEGAKPFTGEFKEAQVVQPGEIVLAHTDLTQARDVIGRTAVVEETPPFTQLVASLDLAIIRPNEDAISKQFLLGVLQSRRFIEHAFAHSNGSTVLHLNSKAAGDFRFAIPPAEERREYERLVEPIRRWSSNLTKERLLLQSLRDQLLPKLISGKIRVPEGVGPDLDEETATEVAEELAEA